MSPPAQAVSVDHRDDGLLEAVHRAVEERLLIQVPLFDRAAVLEFVDVRARNERLVPCARQDGDANRVVRLEVIEGGDDLVLHLRVHRVQFVGPVEPEDRYGPTPLHENRLIGHGRTASESGPAIRG